MADAGNIKTSKTPANENNFEKCWEKFGIFRNVHTFHHSMHVSLSFAESPSRNLIASSWLEIIDCSCAVPSKCVLIFCSFIIQSRFQKKKADHFLKLPETNLNVKWNLVIRKEKYIKHLLNLVIVINIVNCHCPTNQLPHHSNWRYCTTTEYNNC